VRKESLFALCCATAVGLIYLVEKDKGHVGPKPKRLLEEVDAEFHLLATKMMNSEFFTRYKSIKIYVVDRLDGGLACAEKDIGQEPVIYLSRKVLRHKYRDVILAHELGHVESGGGSEVKANIFAAKLCGEKRTLKAIEDKDGLLSFMPGHPSNVSKFLITEMAKGEDVSKSVFFMRY